MINFSSTKTRYTNFDYTMEYQYFSVNFMFVSKICGPELSEYKRRKKKRSAFVKLGRFKLI